jgi:hypothetical protein
VKNFFPFGYCYTALVSLWLISRSFSVAAVPR